MRKFFKDESPNIPYRKIGDEIELAKISIETLIFELQQLREQELKLQKGEQNLFTNTHKGIQRRILILSASLLTTGIVLLAVGVAKNDLMLTLSGVNFINLTLIIACWIHCCGGKKDIRNLAMVSFQKQLMKDNETLENLQQTAQELESSLVKRILAGTLGKDIDLEEIDSIASTICMYFQGESNKNSLFPSQ